MMNRMKEKFKTFQTEFRQDEGGMEIVQTVLLVLVAILAVVLVWGLLSNQLTTWWGTISGDPLSSGTTATDTTDTTSTDGWASVDTSTTTASY